MTRAAVSVRGAPLPAGDTGGGAWATGEGAGELGGTHPAAALIRDGAGLEVGAASKAAGANVPLAASSAAVVVGGAGTPVEDAVFGEASRHPEDRLHAEEVPLLVRAARRAIRGAARAARVLPVVAQLPGRGAARRVGAPAEPLGHGLAHAGAVGGRGVAAHGVRGAELAGGAAATEELAGPVSRAVVSADAAAAVPRP